jgi:hypothetical protein
LGFKPTIAGFELVKTITSPDMINRLHFVIETQYVFV